MAADMNEAALASLPPHSRLACQSCDVRIEADVARLVGRASATFGGVDFVFNAAGVCRAERLVDDGGVWTDTLDINVGGLLNVVRAVIPEMRSRGGGSIVNWGSNSAFRASPDLSAYCVSKAAVVMLTKCIATEHAVDGIRANVISPGYVETPMIAAQAETYGSVRNWRESVATVQPLGIGTAEAVADVAVFLVSESARHMTGSVVTVDGGGIAAAPSIHPPKTDLHIAGQ